MEGDDQDTGAGGRWRRGSIGFGRGWASVSIARGVQAVDHLPMPLGSFESERAELLAAFGVCSPLTMVEVEDERLKVLASGARCVSLSSATCQGRCESDRRRYALLVSFQLMAAAADLSRWRAAGVRGRGTQTGGGRNERGRGARGSGGRGWRWASEGGGLRCAVQ